MPTFNQITGAVQAGWNAFTAAWRVGSTSVYHSNSTWDKYTERMQRYALYELYYNNLQYTEVNKAAHLLRQQGRLYTNIRSIYNPVFRMVNIYADKIYAGSLNLTDLSSGAVPVLADERLIRALIQLFRWSNWNAAKQLYVRQGEKLGDTFIKVVDNPESRRVTLEVLAAQKVKHMEKDAAGNIKELWIEYPDYKDDRPAIFNKTAPAPKEYTVTEILTGYDIKIYHDGELVEEYPNPFGFVPAVHVAIQDEGRMYGSPRWSAVRFKIDEVNSQAALINDQVRKSIIPYLVTQGFAVEAGSVRRTQQNMDETLTIATPKAGMEVGFVSPSVDIPSALDNLAKQLDEIKEDIPELLLYQLTERIAPSGVALRQMYDLAIAKISAAMGLYDDALMRACQMALTIGGVQGYKGFEGINLNSYAAGQLDFTIRQRPVFYDGFTETERVNYLLQSGAPQRGVWSLLGIEEGVMDEWATLIEERDAARISAAIAAQAAGISVDSLDSDGGAQ